MLVCHCLRVCDGKIRECVRAGARSVDDVGDSCGAGTRCGGCVPAIESILVREVEETGEGLIALVLRTREAA